MAQPEDSRSFEIRIRAAERAHDARDRWLTETNETMSALGVEALKAAALISGGSAAGLLAFMGALIAHDRAGVAAWLPWPLSRFVVALLLACIGSGTAYFAQFCLTQGLAHHEKTWIHPYIAESATYPAWRAGGLLFQGLTIGLVVAAYASLIVGYLATYRAISIVGL
ncbi:hypothetical protein LMIY3S_05768 [Labrys miyagiensis]